MEYDLGFIISKMVTPLALLGMIVVPFVLPLTGVTPRDVDVDTATRSSTERFTCML